MTTSSLGVSSDGDGSGAAVSSFTVDSQGRIATINWSASGNGYKGGDEIILKQGLNSAIYTLLASEVNNGALNNLSGKAIQLVRPRQQWGVSGMLRESPYTISELYGNANYWIELRYVSSRGIHSDPVIINWRTRNPNPRLPPVPALVLPGSHQLNAQQVEIDISNASADGSYYPIVEARRGSSSGTLLGYVRGWGATVPLDTVVDASNMSWCAPGMST